MQKVKALLKQVLPSEVIKPLLPTYHWLRAYAANLRFGWPAKNLKVIAVTGTNGKTTTAAFIASILTEAGYKVGLSTTALFQIGDEKWDNELNMTTTNPFALQALLKRMREAKVDWVVLEVTSHALDQSRIYGVPIHTAVMTNLSEDHLDYHKTMDNYAAAKAKLLQKAQVLRILNIDDEWFDYFNAQGKARLLTYGTKDQANVRLTGASLSATRSAIRFRPDGQNLEATLNLPGKFNVYNALAAVAVAEGLGVEVECITAGLEALESVPGRMEAIREGQDFSLWVDYAHMPDAFEQVFESLNHITRGKVIAVFGGSPMHDYKGMGKVAGTMADVVVVTDDEPVNMDPAKIRSAIVKAAEKAKHAKVHEVADRKEAIKKACKLAKPGDSVVLLALGHQHSRRVKDGTMPWDDRAVAREVLAKLSK